jgi:hypothetical protein
VEIHALRGLVEEAVAKLDKEIAAAKEGKPSDAIMENRDVFRHIMDKLPVEFDTLAWRPTDEEEWHPVRPFRGFYQAGRPWCSITPRFPA